MKQIKKKFLRPKILLNVIPGGIIVINTKGL